MCCVQNSVVDLAMDMLCAEALDGLCGAFIIANRQLYPFVTEYFGANDRCDADESKRFALRMDRLNRSSDIVVHLHVRAFDREVAEIFGGTKATWKDEGVHVVCFKF